MDTTKAIQALRRARSAAESVFVYQPYWSREICKAIDEARAALEGSPVTVTPTPTIGPIGDDLSAPRNT